MVLECGLQPEYVFDLAPMYEINALMRNIYRKNKESWEQTRMICYTTVQSQSTKKLKPTDILAFPWDNDNKKSDTSISNEDVDKLKRKANEFKCRFNGQTPA